MSRLTILRLSTIDWMNQESCTSFISFFVRGLPDFVSSGGGMGGAGPERRADEFSRRSIAGSRIENGPRRTFDLLSAGPLRKYGLGRGPGFSEGSGLSFY